MALTDPERAMLRSFQRVLATHPSGVLDTVRKCGVGVADGLRAALDDVDDVTLARVLIPLATFTASLAVKKRSDTDLSLMANALACAAIELATVEMTDTRGTPE